MVNERYAIAMTETLHYLKGVRQNDLDKIPNKFMTFLKDNACKDYKCEFDYTRPLEKLNLKNETRGLIAIICLNYWCETEEQRNNFRKHLDENEKRYQEELREKYNPDNLFKNKYNEIPSEFTENTQLIEIQQYPWYKRLYQKILAIFGIRNK